MKWSFECLPASVIRTSLMFKDWFSFRIRFRWVRYYGGALCFLFSDVHGINHHELTIKKLETLQSHSLDLVSFCRYRTRPSWSLNSANRTYHFCSFSSFFRKISISPHECILTFFFHNEREEEGRIHPHEREVS